MENLAKSRKGKRLIREGREEIWRQQQLVLTTKSEHVEDGPVCTKSDPDGPYAIQNIRRVPCNNTTPIEISSDEDDDFFYIQGEDQEEEMPPTDIPSQNAIVNSVKIERTDDYATESNQGQNCKIQYPSVSLKIEKKTIGNSLQIATLKKNRNLETFFENLNFLIFVC